MDAVAVEDSGHLKPPSPSALDSSLPPYPELIIAAIDALNEPNGSNKTTISRHIVSLYPNLPSSHTTLLTHHLNRMKQNGDLVMVKNNYMRPDQNAPPKRGRGRPRKNAEPNLPGQPALSSSPRPRGRPPKAWDSEAPPKPKPSVSGKKRGRPRKVKGVGGSGSEPVAMTPVAAPAVGEVVKRGRGRPPKSKAAAAVPVGA